MPLVICPHCGFKANREKYRSGLGYKCPKCNEQLLWKDVATKQEKRKDEMMQERTGRRYFYPFQTIRPMSFKRLAHLVHRLSHKDIMVSRTEEKELMVYVKKFLEETGLKCSDRVVRDYTYLITAIAGQYSLAPAL